MSTKQTSTKIDFSSKSELFAAERCLKNYSSNIIKIITKEFLNSRQISNTKLAGSPSILEFGAGIGTLAIEFNRQNNIKPDCIEIDPEQAKVLEERLFICFDATSKLQKKYDAVYTSNVLEHIENDTASIKELYDCLKPGGCLAIYVPASMLLWSRMDELVGHYRRYSKNELCQKVFSAGFKISSCYYVDSIGFLAWLYLKIKNSEKGDAIGSDKSLKFFDTILHPISRFFDALGCRHLFGKNLLLIAIKPSRNKLI